MSRTRLIRCLPVALPVAFVVVLRLGLDLRLTRAAASPAPSEVSQPAHPRMPDADVEQRTHLAWIDSIDINAVRRSPFVLPEALRAKPQSSEPAAPKLEPEQQTGFPPIKITMMASGRERPFSRINDTVHSRGDSIGDGWTIVEIDVDERRIDFVHVDGRIHRVYLDDQGG